MEWWHVYLWTRLNAIQTISFFFSVVLLITWVGKIVAQVCGKTLQDDEAIRCAKAMNFTWIGWLFLIVAILTPSSKDFAMIYVLPKVVESKVIQKDIPDMYDMAMEALTDRLKGFTKKGGNE